MTVQASLTTQARPPRRTLAARCFALVLCAALAPHPARAQVDLDQVTRCMRDNTPAALHVGTVSISTSGSSQVMRGSLSAVSDASGKRLLWSIHAPSDLAGSAVLTRDDSNGAVSYLYLPALGKVRRIDQSDQQGRMFGTDISYGDAERIASSFAGSALTVLGEDRLGGRPVWKIAATAAPDANSPYDRIDLSIDQKTCVTLQADLLSNDVPLKRWSVDPASLAQSGRYWYAAAGTMSDLQQNSQTRLRFTDVSMDTPLPDAAFDPRSFFRSR